jgi:hypothetical protein
VSIHSTALSDHELGSPTRDTADPPTRDGPQLSDIELALAAVSPKKAALILSCSETRLYDLLNLSEAKGGLASYLDAGRRKVLLASIARYQARLIEASTTPQGPAKNHGKIAKASKAGLEAVREKRLQKAREMRAAREAATTTA